MKFFKVCVRMPMCVDCSFGMGKVSIIQMFSQGSDSPEPQLEPGEHDGPLQCRSQGGRV